MVSRVRVGVVLSLVLFIAVLIAGCGGSEPGATSSSAQADPFAGTWRMDSGDRVRFVISTDGDQYTIVQGSPGADGYVPVAVLQRTGDTLSGDATITDTEGRLTLGVGSSPEQLALTFDGPKITGPVTTTLTRLSGSTATPTPVP